MKTFTVFTALALLASINAGAAPQASINSVPAREVLSTGRLGKGVLTLWRASGKLGVTVDNAALRSLPASETTVDLVTNVAPFRLVEIDWHPHGHEPKGVYDVPHFDAHFYVIDKSERDAIAFGAPGTVAKPDSAIVPEGYVTDGTVVPMMGMHFVPGSAPEFHGKPFMCTQIWGYNKGHLAFVEAMFSLQFINGKGAFEQPIAQFKNVPVHGLPHAMTVAGESNGYSVVLAE